MSQILLKKLKMRDFRPLLPFNSGKIQTLAAYFYPTNTHIANNQLHLIKLPDGDHIAITQNKPSQWKPSNRTILLVHGLTGSHLSHYMVRATRLFVEQGYQVIRMDLRGCGAGQGKAKQPYHGGRSEDPRQVIHWLAQRYPQSPVTCIGFSLGANMVLKMAGEAGGKAIGYLDSLIAVSPPMDLYSSVNRLLEPKNRLFEQHFVKELMKEVQKKQHYFPDLIFKTLPKKLNLFQFDDLYTAPMSGFENARDYYQRSSALQFMPNIKLPTLILHADDDPVVCNTAFEHLPESPNLDIFVTAQGGHVGWIGASGDFNRFGYQWMDRVLVEWVRWKEN